MRLWRRYSLRTILLTISLLFLVLPLAGIYFLKIYESALIRQTESELISQAAFVAAIYKKEVQEELAKRNIPIKKYGIPISGNPASKPIPAKLDLAKDKVYSARPFPRETSERLDIIADHAGKDVLPVLKEAQQVTLSGIKVLDYRGIVAAGQEERGLSFAHIDEYRQARAGRAITMLRKRRMPKTEAPLNSLSRNSTVNVFAGLPIVLDGQLIGTVWVNRTAPDLLQALYRKQTELTWTALAMVLAALLITALTSYTVTRPIRELVQKTRLIAEGEPAGMVPIEVPVTREVAALSEGIAEMAKTIQHRTEYIRNLTAHVSHEFKTPLTAIQGSVELLQDHLETMPVEKQRRFLGNILADTERMHRLVIRLLELARADMAETPAARVSLVPVLEAIVPRYSQDGFSVAIINAPEEAVSVSLAADSLEGILGNLLENSRQAGASQVEISVEVQEDTVALRVQDNGPGISEGNRKEIFTPFFTTRRASGGTGLGLSITQSLLERQGGRITLQPSGQGTCFQIVLPIA